MLERGDSATEICRQEVIASEPILPQLIDNFVDLIYPTVEIPGVITPIEFGGRTDYEFGKIYPIDIRRVFDIEKGSEPLFT
jgi:hypothetical protein